MPYGYMWVYALVDDMRKEREEHLKRPQPETECSDSEWIALCLINKYPDWDGKLRYAILGRLGARLDTRLTAHTLCIYIKRRLALHDSLQITTLALPI